MLPHNKIIKTTVKEFLEPENLFQIGSSRSWVDDNGYYFIIVEFATNGYSKGASLNAGVSFLWESTESLSRKLYVQTVEKPCIYMGKQKAIIVGFTVEIISSTGSVRHILSLIWK